MKRWTSAVREAYLRLRLGPMAILELPGPLGFQRVDYGVDPSKFGYLRLPAGSGPHPVVILIHGGFWRSRYSLDHIGHLGAAIASHGWAVWQIEYRRLGEPAGGWPATFQDVAEAGAFLRQLAALYPLDLQRVVALGHSAGGHLALWLAALSKLPVHPDFAALPRNELRAVISLAGVSDLRRASELRLSSGVVDELLGGSPDEQPARYAATSPYDLLPLGTPQVLIHGMDDEIVPLEVSTRYFERAQQLEDPIELVTLRGIGHFELIDPRSSAFDVILQVLKSSPV